jgi:hypothetical protein
MIVLIEGLVGPNNLGSGKTLMMIRYLLKDYKKHKNIFSNIKLHHISYKPLIMEDLLNPEMNQYIKNATIGIDELTLFMDCRKAIKNSFLSYVFLQSRKRHVNFYCTTQDHTMLDFRFVRYVSIFVFAQIIYDEQQEPIKDYRRFTIIDTRNPYRIKKDSFIINITPYYKFYDTDEILLPIMSNSNVKRNR